MYIKGKVERSLVTPLISTLNINLTIFEKEKLILPAGAGGFTGSEKQNKFIRKNPLDRRIVKFLK